MLPERGAHVAQPSTGQKSAMEGNATTASRERWNKGRIVGQKAPFKLKEFRAAQLLPAHSRLELIVRCLGIEVDDAPELAEQTEICLASQPPA